jgi:Domain of unknown function (DUF1963)
VIPWRDGAHSCKVVWDVSDSGRLTKTDPPAVLQELAQASLIEMHAEFKKHGLGTEGLKHPYWGTEQPMKLKATVVLPERGAPEAVADAAFTQLMADEDLADTYADFISDLNYEHAQGLARHRMLGYPAPEQDDPRFAAVALVDYGQAKFWEWEDRPDMAVIESKMSAWHLLLQCDLSDYYQDRLSEGTVYFLIRNDHLRGRHFDQVVAVYQQT